MSPRRSQARVRAVGMVAGAFASLDGAVNVAFPSIDEAFDLDVAGLQWIVICYLLPYGTLLVAAGRVGDLVGHRRLVRVGAIVSFVGLAGCAAAPEYWLFLTARVLQGFGAAGVLAGAPALLTTSTEEAHRGRAVSWFQTASMVGLAVGPILAGPLIELAGWRSVYWFRLPIALGLGLLALGHDEVVRLQWRRVTDRIDAGEMLAAIASLAALVSALSLGRTWGWSHPGTLGLAVAAFGLGVRFVQRNRRSVRPTVDPALWRRPGFAAANALTALINGASFPIWLLAPSFLLDERDLAVTTGGIVLACVPAASAIGSTAAGRLVDRRPLHHVAAAGIAVAAIGMALIGAMADEGALSLVVVGMALTGLGVGIFSVPNMHQVMASLPVEHQGVAGGLSLMMRTLGVVTIVAVASAVFDPIEQAEGFVPAFRAVFLGAAAVIAGLLTLAARPARAEVSSGVN